MKHAATAKIVIPAGISDRGVPYVASNCWVMGHLTTEHSASSYGQPVFVPLDVEPFSGVYGPGDVASVSLGVDVDHLDDAVGERLIRAARHVGFSID